MDLITAIETRTSIREFKNEPVDINIVKEIIRLAGYAPSVNSYQPWKYYVISNKDLMEKMVAEILNEIARMPENKSRMAKHLKNQTAWFSTFFRTAPMLLALAGHPYETDLEKGVVITHDELDKINNYPDLQSAGASIQNLLLAATAKGYGTCWMTGPLFAREKIQKLLDIQDPWRLLSFVAIGKADGDTKKTRTKRDLSKEIVVIV